MRTGLHAVWSALGALRSFVSNFVLPHARGRGPTSTSKPSPAPGISCIGSFALALVLVLLSPSPAAAQVTTSAQLNGSGTFTIPGLYLGANITLEGWVYLRSSVAAPSLVEVGTGGSSYLVVLRVGDGTGKPYIAVYDALGNLVSQATSPIAIPLNTWVHLAGTIENNAGSISRIYINGVHVYAVTYGGTGAPAVSRNVNYIGRSATGEPNLDGFVADVRIWNLARTPDQIKAGMPFGSIAQPTTGLTAAYPFGATGQPVLNDVSGNNRTLTPSGTILYQTAGPASPLPGPPMDVSAADLGGVGSLTFAPTGTLGGSLTLEGWVNPRSQANGGRIVDVGTSTNKATLLASSTTNGRPALSIDVGGSNVLSLAAINPIPSNGWSHVAGVLNADRSAQLYVNGQLVASGTASQAFSASAPVTGFVGAGRNPGDALLNASLADVRIWTTGRTAAQVQSTMPAGSITGPATGLLAAYPFGQTGQPILNDVSGNNVTLTQAGTIQFKATAPPSRGRRRRGQMARAGVT